MTDTRKVSVEDRIRERIARRPYSIQQLAVAEGLSQRAVRAALEAMQAAGDIELHYALGPTRPLRSAPSVAAAGNRATKKQASKTVKKSAGKSARKPATK